MASNEQTFEFNFTSEDEPIVQAAAAAVTAPVELEPKESEQEPIEPVIPESPKEEEELDLEGYSQAALYALSLQKTDGFFPDDIEIKKDLTAAELKVLIKENAIRESEEEKEKRLQEVEEEAKARLAEKGLTDSHYAYIQQIINGGDPQVVSKVAQFRSWSEFEPSTEEEMEAVVRAGLKIKYGAGEAEAKMIDSHIKNDLSDSEALAAAAKEQQAYIAQVADYLEEQDKLRVKNLREQELQEEKKYATEVEKQVKSGFYGLNLKKSEQQELIDYMTKKNVVIDIDTPNGKVRQKVTQEEADRIRDRADLGKRAYEAYQRKIGYDKVVNKLVDVANTTSTDKYLKSIRQIEENQNQTPTPRPKGELYMEIEI